MIEVMDSLIVVVVDVVVVVAIVLAQLEFFGIENVPFATICFPDKLHMFNRLRYIGIVDLTMGKCGFESQSIDILIWHLLV